MAYNSDKNPAGLTELTTLENDDKVIVGDTSDPEEQVKRISVANFKTLLKAFVLTFSNIFSDADKSKLDGIATGAEVNPAVATQAEMEAGTSTSERSMTPQRVAQSATFQAIANRYPPLNKDMNLVDLKNIGFINTGQIAYKHQTRSGITGNVQLGAGTRVLFKTVPGSSVNINITNFENGEFFTIAFMYDANNPGAAVTFDNTIDWGGRPQLTKTPDIDGDAYYLTFYKEGDTVHAFEWVDPVQLRKLETVEVNAEENPPTVSASEAQAGTSTTVMSWTAQRVRQAISAFTSAFTSAEKTKLAGIATGATADPKTATTAEAIAGSETALRSWSPKFVKDSTVYHPVKEYALGSETTTVSDRDPIIHVALNGSGGTLSLSSISTAHNSETTIELHNASNNTERDMRWEGDGDFNTRWIGDAVTNFEPNERRIVKSIKTGTTFRLVDITAHVPIEEKLDDIQDRASVSVVPIKRITFDVVSTIGTTANTIEHRADNDTSDLELVVNNSDLVELNTDLYLIDTVAINIYNEGSGGTFEHEAVFKVDSTTTSSAGLNKTKLVFNGSVESYDGDSFSLGSVGNDTRLHFMVRNPYGMTVPQVADHNDVARYNSQGQVEAGKITFSSFTDDNQNLNDRSLYNIGNTSYDTQAFTISGTHNLDAREDLNHELTLNAVPIFIINMRDGQYAEVTLKYQTARWYIIWPAGIVWPWHEPKQGPSSTSGDYHIRFQKINGEIRGYFLDPDILAEIDVAPSPIRHYVRDISYKKDEIIRYQNILYLVLVDNDGSNLPVNNATQYKPMTSDSIVGFGEIADDRAVEYNFEVTEAVATDADDVTQTIITNVDETLLSDFPLQIVREDSGKFECRSGSTTMTFDTDLTVDIFTWGEPDARTGNLRLQARHYDSSADTTTAWQQLASNGSISMAQGEHATEVTLTHQDKTFSMDRGDTLEFRWAWTVNIASPRVSINLGQENPFSAQITGAAENLSVVTSTSDNKLVSKVYNDSGTVVTTDLVHFNTATGKPYYIGPKTNVRELTTISSLTPDCDEYTHYTISNQAGTLSLHTPIGDNVVIGTTIVFYVKSTSNRTISYNSNYIKAGSDLITTLTANKAITITAMHVGNSKWSTVSVEQE